jgi:hypothetical protein
MSDTKSLEDTKKEILAELKESTKLEDTDFEKFVKSADSLVELVRTTRAEAGAKRIDLRDLQEKYQQDKTNFETEKKTLLETKQKEIDDAIKAIEEKYKDFEPLKEKATKFEAYDAEKRKAIKEVLGDKWLSSFDTMPLLDLEKVFNNLMPDNKLTDHDNGKGKKHTDKEIFTMEELKKFSQAELMADKDLLAKVNKSLTFHNKK